MSVILLVLSVAITCGAAKIMTVNPTEHNRLMQTPGSGFQDFVGLLPSPANLASCQLERRPVTASDSAGLEGGSIYVRFLWRDVEPEKGQFNWLQFDRIFECAKQQRKTVDFRLMLSFPARGDTNCIEGVDDPVTHGIPCWMVRKGVRERLYSADMPRAVAQSTYLPDWEDATLRQDHAELVWAFANRYRDNSRLNSVEIGSAGLWGEWHTFPDKSLMPSNQRAKEIIDLYANAFPTTPLVVLAEVFKNDLAGDSAVADHLRNNYKGRYGWRGDSWGGFGHHSQDYNPINKKNSELWKTGPVAMEVTRVMNDWPARQDGSGSYGSVVGIGQAATDALAWHTSCAHNKASNFPAEFSNSLTWMSTRMGSRLVLNQLSYPSVVQAGRSLLVKTRWHNRGVAPLYRDFRMAFRFANQAAGSQIVTTGQAMKGLLPTGNSPVAKSPSVLIPASLQTGLWTVEVGVVYHSDASLRIPIAITNRSDNDWYWMGELNVLAA